MESPAHPWWRNGDLIYLPRYNTMQAAWGIFAPPGEHGHQGWEPWTRDNIGDAHLRVSVPLGAEDSLVREAAGGSNDGIFEYIAYRMQFVNPDGSRFSIQVGCDGEPPPPLGAYNRVKEIFRSKLPNVQFIEPPPFEDPLPPQLDWKGELDAWDAFERDPNRKPREAMRAALVAYLACPMTTVAADGTKVFVREHHDGTNRFRCYWPEGSHEPPWPDNANDGTALRLLTNLLMDAPNYDEHTRVVPADDLLRLVQLLAT